MRRNWFKIAIDFLGFGLASAVSPARLSALGAMRKRYMGRQERLEAMIATPAELALECEPFAVRNAKGTRIAGWWLPAAEARATLLMVHGFNKNKSHMLKRARAFVAIGVNVALLDLRARGESGGELTDPGPPAGDDVLAVLARVLERPEGRLPLLFYGFSHGARTVLFAAQASATKPVAIVAEAPPFSLRDSFKRQTGIPVAPPIPEGDLVGACRALTELPVLYMFGDRDPDLTSEQAQALAACSAHAATSVEVFAATGHGVHTLDNADQFDATVTRFVERVLS